MKLVSLQIFPKISIKLMELFGLNLSLCINMDQIMMIVEMLSENKKKIERA